MAVMTGQKSCCRSKPCLTFIGVTTHHVSRLTGIIADAMIRSKKELADLSVKTGETWLGDLSDEDLKELVSLE